MSEKFNVKRFFITFAIVLLTAGVTAGPTWYFMDQVSKEQEKTISALEEQNKKITESKENSNKDKEELQSKSSDNELAIKELGIKIDLTDLIKNLYYVEKDNYVYFGTKDLDSMGGSYCKATLSNDFGVPEGPLGFAFIDSSNKNTKGELIKNINNKYLYFANPQATCSSDSSVNDIESSSLKALKEALKSAVSI